MNFQQGADLDRRCDCSRYEKALVASMSQRVNVSGDDAPSLSQFLTGKFHVDIISLARCSKSPTNAVQCWTLSSVALSGSQWRPRRVSCHHVQKSPPSTYAFFLDQPRRTIQFTIARIPRLLYVKQLRQRPVKHRHQRRIEIRP